MTKRTRPIVAVLENDAVSDLTPEMEALVRDLLTDLPFPPVLVFPDRDAVQRVPAPFACTVVPAEMTSVL